MLLLTTVDGDSIYEQEQIAKALEVMRALPLVSQGTLTALRELRLPIGRLRASTVDEAVRQAAHKPRRAWDVGTVTLGKIARGPTAFPDLSALTGCAGLHTVLFNANVTDLSPLADCPTLHTLDIYGCDELSDVSARGLRDAPHAQPLVVQESDGRIGAGGLRDVTYAQALSLRGDGSPARRYTRSSSSNAME